jgi:hypothetical protein
MEFISIVECVLFLKGDLEMDRPKIGVCMHSHDSMRFDVFPNHVQAIATWSREFEIKLFTTKGLTNAVARNMMIESSIQQGCTHVLFIDDDHLIPLNMLNLLYESRDHAIISGLVCKRAHPFKQIGWIKREDGMFSELHFPFDGNIYEVDVCAFGCTLVNLDKIKKLDKPYFRDVCEKSSNVDDPMFYNVRSDVNLCLAFRKLNEKCWVDTRVLIGHISDYGVVYPQNASFMKEYYEKYHQSCDLKENERGYYYKLAMGVWADSRGTDSGEDKSEDKSGRSIGEGNGNTGEMLERVDCKVV